MITVNVRTDTRQLSRGFACLTKKEVAKATSMAINKTLLKGRTVARTAVKQMYNIPQRYLQGIGVKRSNAVNLKGYIYASTKPIPMDAFSPRFQLITGGKVSGVQSITKRGSVRVKSVKRARQQGGVTIEVKRGEKQVVPYAFLLPNSKPRVFARGEYKSGNGSYGFVQRHKRSESDNGNDSVKPLLSVTVFGAVINPVVKRNIANVLKADYKRNLAAALRIQAQRRGMV